MTPHSAAVKGDVMRLENEVKIMKKAGDRLADAEPSSMQDGHAHIARLSSPYALPTEILVMIFQSGPSDVFYHGSYVISISQVSHHWRCISLATPSLWSFFRLVPYSLPSQLKMIETFIDRSCSHPISIVIDVENSFSERDDIVDDLYPQLVLVVPLISRWRNLFIQGSFYEDISDVCGPLGELCAPLLESFEVVINSEEGRENYVDDHLQVFTAGAPRLSHIRIQGVSLESCLPPLTSLVSLNLHFPPMPLTCNQFRRILTASNQLRNLHISGNVSDIYFRSPAVEIPSLCSLVVVSTLDTDLSNLLIFLECPALEHLTVGSIMTYDILPALENAVRTTNGPSRYPCLQSLTLRSVKFVNWWQTDWVVIMLPSITHIVIDSCTNPKILLYTLLPLKWARESDADELDAGELDEDSDGGSSVSWPLLQTITLSDMSSTGVEVLYDVISDRISRGTPLASIRLSSMHISADRLEWLQARVRVEIIKD